jgi:pimeloyl-ACP methyl ester carboxylesterase
MVDFAEDVWELMCLEGIETAHIVGWSIGGGVTLQLAISHAANVLSLTLEATISPFGMGGTKGIQGTPCWEDYAGSGCGRAPEALFASLQAKDMSLSNPLSLPSIWKGYVFKPPYFPDQDVVDRYCAEAFKSRISVEFYPGDVLSSHNWPGYKPGTKGILNAMSPAYCDLSAFARIQSGPPVLWIRGDSDLIISDEPVGSPGYQGKVGALQGWPGEEVFPPQPMLGQTRHLLQCYAENGGFYQELVLESCGHAPHIEKEAAFLSALISFLNNVKS